MAESVKSRRHYSLADSMQMYTVGSRQWSLTENFDMITTTTLDVENMNVTPSYRLGWAMAENGKPRPSNNFLTFLRENGQSAFFTTERAFDEAEERHKLRLMGWDGYTATTKWSKG
jgi:hypothetical protein